MYSVYLDYSAGIVELGSNDCFTCDDCFKFVENITRLAISAEPNMDKLSNCLKVYEHFDVEVQIMARQLPWTK